MLFTSSPRRVDRAQPHLGTLVSVRADGLTETAANSVIDAAFAEVAAIHSLMSFHEPDSELSRLNRSAATAPVAVDERTHEVLRRAVAFAADSGGAFDPTIANHLVNWGFLPAAHLGDAPDQDASWRDIEIGTDGRVRFHRRLWIDLGGIAKGYAVDRAVEKMTSLEGGHYLVNAGGDLRVAGAGAERLYLRLPTSQPDGMIPAIDLEDGSLASSSGREHMRAYKNMKVGPHVHARRKRSMGLSSFVSVVAEKCVVADALTKIVLANGPQSTAILRKYKATAYLHSARNGWRTLGIGV